MKGFYKIVETYRRNIDELNTLNPNIMVFIVYGLLYDAGLNVYKPFSMKFLTRLGGDETFISLLNSLPGMVAALALLPGAIFLSGYENRRRALNKRSVNSLIRAFFLVSRSILLGIVFIPFFPDRLRPVLYVAMLSLMNFPDALSQTAVQASLGKYFKNGNVRATAISLRNKFANIFTPAVTILTGVIISVFPKNDEQVIIFYQLFFLAAFAIGMLEIITFKRFREERGAEAVSENKTSLRTVAKVFKDKKFINYMTTTLVFYFSWHAGWALSWIYQIQTLGANEIWLTVFAVATGVSSFLAAGFWSGRIKKYGNDRTLLFASFCVVFTMFAFGLSPNLYVMTLASVYSGFASVGMSIVLLNSLIAETPDEDRMVYIGVYNTFTSVSLGVAPMASLFLMNKTGIGAAYTMFVVGAARFLSALTIWVRNGRRGGS